MRSSADPPGAAVASSRLDAVRPLVDRLLADPRIDSAYAAGSLVAGLGTATSDLDLVLLTADEASTGVAGRAADVLRSAARIDVEVHGLAATGRAVDQFAEFGVDFADQSKLYSVASAVKLVGQLHAGALVLKDSATLRRLRADVAANADVLRRISVARDVIFGNNTLDDLVGFVVDRDLPGALRRSHDLLEFGLDAWCTARGSAYPDEKMKWLSRRLAGTVTDGPTRRRLTELYQPELGAAGTDVRHTVGERLSVTQALLAQAMLAVWSPCPEQVSGPVLGTAPDPHGWWRSPLWMVTRSDDRWGMCDLTDSYAVPVTAVLAWAHADGAGTDRLADAVVTYAARWYRLRVSAPTARSVVRRLVDLGVLVAETPHAFVNDLGKEVKTMTEKDTVEVELLSLEDEEAVIGGSAIEPLNELTIRCSG